MGICHDNRKENGNCYHGLYGGYMGGYMEIMLFCCHKGGLWRKGKMFASPPGSLHSQGKQEELSRAFVSPSISRLLSPGSSSI